MTEKTETGINENLEGLLCYLLGWLTGIIFYIIEAKNKFVRFHAIQSILVFLPLSVILFIVGFIPFIGWILSIIIGIIIFILWIVLMFKAYKGEKFKLPVVGDIAENKTK